MSQGIPVEPALLLLDEPYQALESAPLEDQGAAGLGAEAVVWVNLLQN